MSDPGTDPSDRAPTDGAAAGRAPAGDGAEADHDTDHGTGPAGGDSPRSGLANPARALRGVGAGTLAIEALVLLLAILPLRALGVPHLAVGIGGCLALAAACVVLAGLLRHRWAWYAGLALQVLVVAGGLTQWAIGVLGVVFGAIWLYVLHLRRTILGHR